MTRAVSGAPHRPIAPSRATHARPAAALLHLMPSDRSRCDNFSLGQRLAMHHHLKE
jgi:hypothetical protein